MTETITEYISSTDELLVEDDGELDDEVESVTTAYEVEYNDERYDDGAVLIESEFDDFSLVVTGLDVDEEDDLVENTDEIMGSIVEMRKFQDEHGGMLEHRAETCGLDIGAPEPIPVNVTYVFNQEIPFKGVRMHTQVDGFNYGFEVGARQVEIEQTDFDLYEMQAERQLRRLYEELIDDFILDNVTLDED